MTEQGQTNVMQDLSKGYVPIVMVIAMLGTAVTTALWLKTNQMQVETMGRDVQDLKLQIGTLSNTVAQLTVTLAKGMPLPENVAYKADLLKFCLENREIKCPNL